jgi:hypothetical protein
MLQACESEIARCEICSSYDPNGGGGAVAHYAKRRHSLALASPQLLYLATQQNIPSRLFRMKGQHHTFRLADAMKMTLHQIRLEANEPQKPGIS